MFGMILTTSPYCPKNSYRCSVCAICASVIVSNRLNAMFVT